MKYNNYAHIELDIIAKSKQDLGNTANYKNLAKWNNSSQGNITTVGTNGQSSYYGLFDTSGQVYEWTDTSDEEYDELKICRGGCYADKEAFAISKNNRKKFHYDSMLSEGFFGFRIASIDNPDNLNYNFLLIANSGNAHDSCETDPIGSVNYNYNISAYLVTNEQYCEFLNTIDPSGNNKHKIYDLRMNDSPVGGIVLKTCNNIGNKYLVKEMMDSKPVTFIKWIMAAKFVNWLHNNKSANDNDIYFGAYDLSNNVFTRETNAKYFLPNEHEWYKASYFDPNKNNNGPGYWTYGTRSDIAPLAILTNEFGIAAYAEGYHYSSKKFPIIVNKNFESFSSLATSDTPTDACPIISISGQPASSSNNYLYFINSTISNLEYGYTYNYNFSSSFANWPGKINPLSGTFTAYNETQEINALLEFCPKNFRSVDLCDSNLNYSNVDDDETNFLINLELMVTPSNSCNNNIIQNYLVAASGLPSINPNVTKYLNIEFADKGNNSIVVSGNQCCQPIPITINVSGHQPGELYNYNLLSSSNSLQLTPSSGMVSFGNQIGKITTFVIGLNNNISVLTANLAKKNDSTVTSSDQILLQCISNCSKSCENHANFNNKAVWGVCETITCDNIYDIPVSIEARVTTVGSNGGPSSYNTYDMDGNVWELVHAGNLTNGSATYKTRGGSFKSSSVGRDSIGSTSLPSTEIGFRVGSYNNPYNYLDYEFVQDVGTIPTGNKPDYNGYGNVPYSFRMSKYPVTNCEYAEFLNSVASTGISLALSNMVYHTGMSGCYGGIDRNTNGNNYVYNVQECMDHKPVRNVSNYGILKYINWLNNNKANGWNNSSNGTYVLNNTSIVSGNRSACAEYFLPSENEWYKTAYYKGSNTNNTDAGYWNYSTMSMAIPDPVLATNCGEGSIIDCDPAETKPPCTI